MVMNHVHGIVCMCPNITRKELVFEVIQSATDIIESLLKSSLLMKKKVIECRCNEANYNYQGVLEKPNEMKYQKDII